MNIVGYLVPIAFGLASIGSAIGVALTTQCEMCLESHVKAALDLGATQEEIAETTFITAALRAGAAYTHGMKAIRMIHDQEGTHS